MQLENAHFHDANGVDTNQTSYLIANGDSGSAHLGYYNSNGAVFPNTTNHYNGIAFFKASETPIGVSLATDFNIPTESGWYAIQLRTTDHKGKWYINVDEEFQQNNTNCYALRLDDKTFFENQATPARGIVYVEIDGNNHYIRSINGHYATSKGVCKVSDNEPNFSIGGMTRSVQFTAGSDNNPKTCNIGNYWNNWTAGGTDPNPNGYIFNGASGSNTTCSYGFYAANPELNYDVWTVTIENETYQSLIKKNLRVTLNHPQNAGLASVYHNGNFFLPKGSTISKSDLSMISNDAHTGMSAIFTIDNTAHTIVATMSHPTALLRPMLEEYKEDQDRRSSQIAKLAATPWYDAETAAAKITAIYENITIADADLNEEGFEAAKAKVDAAAITAIREIIDGKKIYMACSVNDNNGEYDNIVGVSEIGSNVHHIAPTDPISIDAVWVIDFTDDTHVTLQNVVYNNYLNGLVAGTSGMEYKFDFAVANNGTFTFCNESIANNNKYLNQYPSHNLGYWTAGLSNGGSFWFITLVTPELEQGLKQSWLDLALAEPTFDGYTMGEEPGLYVRSDKYDQFIEAQNELRAAGVENFDYAKVSSVLNAEGRTPVLFDLNGLEGPALIQMAYTPAGYTFASLWSGKGFISAQNHSNGLAGTDFDHIATFVLENGRLHSLNSGIGIINGGTGPKVYEGENWSDNVNSMQVTFANVGRTDLVTPPNDDTPRHCYSIKEAGTNNTFGGSGAEGGTISWGDVAGTPAGNYAYTIWYVKNLTVDVEDGGYKLWRTPVAVNFGGNDESGAYVVSVNGTRITTTAVDGSDTYGAGTMFLLTQTVNLAVENGRHVEAPAAGLGHHAKQMHTLTAGKVYLSIHTDAVAPEAPEAEQNGYALYFDAPESKNTVTMDVVVPTEDTQKLLEAHEALIEATNANEDPLKSGTTMELALGGSSDTTQLTELTAEGRNANSVYDLQGRKLAAPAKGINIINGKKVLVK